MFGKLIPTWIWLAAIGVLAVLLGASHMNTLREKTRFANYKAEAEKIAREASEEQRRVETRRQLRVDMEVKNAQPKIEAERADAAVARTDTGVRQSAGRVLYRACPHPSPAASSAATTDPAVVLADVLGRIDARAGELAELAGQRGTAGALCEAYADALKP